MKKPIAYFVFLFGFLVNLFFYFVVPSEISSQTDFANAYKEYTLRVESYKVAHDEYILARSQYLKFKTLTSENNAKEATIRMLEARDEVLIKYLVALKVRIDEIKGTSNETRESLFLRLDEEMKWFLDHKDHLSSAGTLDDLVSDSDKAKKRFESIDPLIYEALSTISSGRLNNLKERLNNIFSDVRNKINEIKEEEREEYKFSTRKIQIIERWISETESRIARGEEKRAEAKTLISGITGKGKSVDRYNEVLTKLNEGQQYFREASLNVVEIISEIKTAE